MLSPARLTEVSLKLLLVAKRLGAKGGRENGKEGRDREKKDREREREIERDYIATAINISM